MRKLHSSKIKLWGFAATALAFLFPAAASLRAQSLPETVESIDKARVVTRILFITAHPDDEASGLLSFLSHGLHADVALLTLTRGQGGQNAIGPEQGERLGCSGFGQETNSPAGDVPYVGQFRDCLFSSINPPVLFLTHAGEPRPTSLKGRDRSVA